MIIDFHTHVFPDAIAQHALPQLETAAGVKAPLDATLGQLLDSMDRAGIDVAVVQHIATKPGQEKTINKWAAAIQNERLVSFGTIHPDSPDWREEIERLKDLGLPGVKFHPDYQGFYVDEGRMLPIYEVLCQANLAVLFHAGIDIGLPDPCHCTPDRLRRIIDRYPRGRWIAAHMGGYQHWQAVEEFLVGQPIYFDTSYSHAALGKERMRRLILAHGTDKILFGSDSPWVDQLQAVKDINQIGLDSAVVDGILAGNARKLLQLTRFSPVP